MRRPGWPILPNMILAVVMRTGCAEDHGDGEHTDRSHQSCSVKAPKHPAFLPEGSWLCVGVVGLALLPGLRRPCCGEISQLLDDKPSQFGAGGSKPWTPGNCVAFAIYPLSSCGILRGGDSRSNGATGRVAANSGV